MLRINQIKLPVGHASEALSEAIVKKLHIKYEELISFHILRCSLDARKSRKSGNSSDIFYIYSVKAHIKHEQNCLKRLKKTPDVQIYTESPYRFEITGSQMLDQPPVIIGSGPAGLFAGLMLARHGYKPLILERGADVDMRMKDVQDFWESGILNPDSNVQFGEGGAGTFSDGKLNTLVKDPFGRHKKVLELFVEAGAPDEILYMQKPHIGTDCLVDIVRHIRKEIEVLGGCVRFHAKVTDITVSEAQEITGVTVNDHEFIPAGCVVLAVGHSARDTYEMLYRHHMSIAQKPFAIGVRIEHPQQIINQSQYGTFAESLPAADYKLTYETEDHRHVYSFCMCPGGYVVNASSEADGCAVNGMSNHARDSVNANSALVVNIRTEDFENDHPLAGVEFQRRFERLACRFGQGNVPVQLYADFAEGRTSQAFGNIAPVHKGKTAFADLNECLPPYVTESLKEAIPVFGRRIAGYDDPEAILSGVETRTSSPVKMERDEVFESNLRGLYPCGEGAGYAGGITSAAMDGLRIAEAIAAKYTIREKHHE